MRTFYLLFSVVCSITISSAHEHDYMDTRRNMRLLREKPMIIPMPDFKSIFFPTSPKPEVDNADFREEHDDVFKMIEMALSDMSDENLIARLQDEQKKTGNNDTPEEHEESLLKDLAKCRNDTSVFIQSVQSNATWAMQMLDSYGLPFGGLLEGDSKFYGTYDECLKVEAVLPASGNFRGKYCLATLKPDPGQTGPLASIKLTLGMCVPDSCNSGQASAVLNEYLESYNIKYSGRLNCQERDRPLNNKAIVAIVVCAILVFLVILGTAYDIIFHQILKDSDTNLFTAARYGSLSNTRSTSEKTSLLNSTSSIADSQSMDLRPIYDEGEPVLDSYGLPFGGLLEGDSKFYGTYDECLKVEAVLPASGNFRGKYCLATLKPDPGQTGPLASIKLTLGMCVPDSCNSGQASAVLNEYLESYNIKYSGRLNCQERDRPLNNKAIVAIVVCAILVFLVILGTAYDIIFHQILKDSDTNLFTAARYGSLSNTRSTSEKTSLLNSTSSIADSQSMDLRPIYDEGEPALIARLLLSFSAYTNGAKILNTKQAKGSLTAVHGIRFLSISWVILGHAYITVMVDSAGLATYLQTSLKRWTFHAIINALVSVDSFFAMSGLLVTYLTLKELKRLKGDGRFWAGFWGKFYFHRFWRLTPVYMISLMIFVCLFQYMYDGPKWSEIDCSDTWWTNLLYVNNLVKRDQMCMAWSWYLANDMQFYVISPLIILPLFYYPIAGAIMWLIFLVGTMITAGVITKVNKLTPGFYYAVDVTDTGNYNDYYMTPYCRMGSYLAGMAAGYCLYRVDGTYKLKKSYALIGWCVAAASALAVLYGPYESANGTSMTLDVSALYNAVHRTVWGAAVSWVIWACATGNGGYVNTILSWSGFVPLSRLSYAVYLIHIIVESVYTNSLRKVTHMDDINMTYLFLGMMTLSYLVAFVVSLCFEVPMMGLEKILLKKERKT